MIAVDVHQAYGETVVLERVTFSVPDFNAQSEVITVMGPSGCGKSTLLRHVAGLQRPTRGQVTLRETAQRYDAERMPVPYVFQHATVLPWRTARENVQVALDIAGSADDPLRYLDEVGIAGTADRKAKTPQLSGGQLRRLEIARALASLEQPRAQRLLMLDEPFAGLDVRSRAAVEQVVLDAAAKYDLTVLLTSHDPVEAVRLSDLVVVLSGMPTTVCRLQPISQAFGGPIPRTVPDRLAHPSAVGLITAIEQALGAPHVA